MSLRAAWSSLEADPRREILVTPQGRFSAEQLWHRAQGWAAALAATGVGPGDRVALCLPNGVDMVTLLQGCFWLGAVAMPLHPRTPPPRVQEVLAQTGARRLVTPGSLVPADAKPVPRRAADDHAPALILHTSGSTGEGKGVVLSRHNVATTLAAIQGYLPLGPGDVVHCGLPLSFGYGLYQLLQAMHGGARLVLDEDLAFPARTLATLAREHVTVFPAVPTTLAMVLQLRELRPGSWPALHTVTSAGAALGPSQAQRLCELFAPARVLAMYGLTECQRVSWCDTARAPSGSIGRGLPGLDLWLEDETGRRLAEGEAEGELVVRGPQVMLGYCPAGGADALGPLGDPAQPRVLRTGDLMRRDAQGWLYVMGRRDEVFKSRGEKVSPLAVEAVIQGLAGVAEVAVAGEDDELLGQAVVAHVVRRPGAALSARMVLARCQAELPAHQIPKRVEFVPALPRTPAGKIRRSELRKPRP